MTEQKHDGKTAEQWGMTPEHFDRWREEIDPGDGSSALDPSAEDVLRRLRDGSWSRDDLVGVVRAMRAAGDLPDDEYALIVEQLPELDGVPVED